MIFHRLKNAHGFVAAIFKMSQLIWQAQPACFVGLIVLKALQGLMPLATAWLTKLLFDLLARSLQGGGTASLPQGLLLLLAAQAGLSLMSQAISPVQQYLHRELEHQLSLEIQTSIYEKISRLDGLTYFEDSRFHDTIQLAAQRAQQGPSQALNVLMTLGQNAVTLLSFLGVLIAFNPLLALAIGLTVLPQFYAQIKLGRQRFQLAFDNSRKERRATYYSYILTGIPFAKEVRLFNLGAYFLQAFVRLSQEIYYSQRSQQHREMRWQIALNALSGIVSSGAFVIVVLRAFTGHLSLGDITLYIYAVMSVQGTLIGIVFALSQINESVLFYNQYTTLLALPQPLPSQVHPVPPLKSGIEFCNVSFRYGEHHSWVLRHFNLSIPAGQCVALVGLNGAGKTTLVKLLTRLYDPTEGYILWDGIDIRELDLTDLRGHVGTIFQDFVRYALTAYENIGLGDIINMKHSSIVQQAAIKAGIHEAIQGLPQGYETILSYWLGEKNTGGDLSGGEWQKIALARMFMRHADLLILDEPTAALDAQAENELHSRFVELVAERTSLLITHRFSTVRMATAIAVLENGQIIEHGSHRELVALQGTYAQLYNMQAERYQ
ncbi:MAG: ABC transporter ATP-binding protein [Ktedonobacteraceae bacterium]